MNEDGRPRILVLGGKVTSQHPVTKLLAEHFCVEQIDDYEQALSALRTKTYHGIFADVGDYLPLERGLVGQQSAMVLNTIGEGVCIVDAQGLCVWSNNRMRNYSPEVYEKVKQFCVQGRGVFSKQVGGVSDPLQYRNKKYSFEVQGDRYFELMVSPLVDGEGQVQQVVGVVWDATSGRRLQQKIDAIDSAGRELAKLESEAISKLSPTERLKLLRDKIIRYSKDLMHFEHFAIRVLDPRSNKLEPVIAEGLPADAMDVDLYAHPEGNGISGYVAATGRSYICHDAQKDPRYILGIENCRSSLTVPLRLHDKILGVFNIESREVGAFNEDDRQFAEIFGRYVALALHILDLMVVERCTVTGKLADNVVQELAQPLNDIVTEAQTLMEEYIGDDTMRAKLNKITEDVELIRRTIRDVAAGPRAILGTEDVVAEPKDPLLCGKRVLVADDELNIRKTIADVLGKHGCECVVCKDGYEAMCVLDQQKFDLVISDIKMPHRNGYEIFASARRRCEGMPVILMTGFGYDPNHSIVRASQEGLSTVLFKPFKVAQLLEEIRKALTRSPSDPASLADGSVP
jgi:CheY-like chemotaxis protein/GAF domain-containing protein